MVGYMTLQEALGTLTERFPPDAHTAELGVIHAENGKRVYDPICGVGIVPQGDTFMIALICQSEIVRICEQTGKPPELWKTLEA